DDVMNKQRKEIYAFRNEVLAIEDIESTANDVIVSVCIQGGEDYLSGSQEHGWNPQGYRQWLMQLFPITFEESEFDYDVMDADKIVEDASNKILKAFREKLERENQK